MKHRLAIVTSHVIQYQAPLFRMLAERPEIDLEVLFCSRRGLDAYRDEGLGVNLRWDLDLTGGYPHRFLRNLSPFDRTSGSGLINPGLFTALRRSRYDAVLFMLGWGSVTAWIGYAACILKSIPFFIYGDSSFVPEERSPFARARERLLRFLFARAAGFMITGRYNADYYRHYGGSDERFFFMPWAIDNERFAAAATMSGEEKRSIRRELGIAEEAFVILFSGKLIERKRPGDLLAAFERMNERGNAALVFVGDGELRPALEGEAEARGLQGVHFVGFVNQSRLPQIYGAADVLVLPSAFDPRATVVNEAMASGLPVIVTDRVGPSGDIVRHGENGFVIALEDVAGLAGRLDSLATNAEARCRMAARSQAIIAKWNYDMDVAGVVQALDALMA
ncbi:MAG TPA: glycosyltransferase family 4 protein [Thermoanaerobaculia bacterium]|nr:glycosyltransferase family 4 protein [Thermoanaerobaculia bacterium]